MIDSKNVRPLNDWVLVKREPPENRLGSGLLYAPDNRIEKNLRCEVVAVGEGFYRKDCWEPFDVKVGDIVMIRQWSGTRINANDELHLLVQYDLIEAIYVSNN